MYLCGSWEMLHEKKPTISVILSACMLGVSHIMGVVILFTIPIVCWQALQSDQVWSYVAAQTGLHYNWKQS